MVSALTSEPGSMRIRTTVASVSAGICRTASCEGTRDPTPRTWRSIDPRFTVSVQTVPRSTVGAAGRSRYTATVTAATATMTTADTAICRLRFCSLNSGRAISITRAVASSAPFGLRLQVIETEQNGTTRNPYGKARNVRIEERTVHDRTVGKYSLHSSGWELVRRSDSAALARNHRFLD